MTTRQKKAFKRTIRERLQAKRRLSPKQQRKFTSMVRCGAQARTAKKDVPKAEDFGPSILEAAIPVMQECRRMEEATVTMAVVERPILAAPKSPEQLAEERGWKRDKSGRWRENGKFVRKEMLADLGLTNGK